MAYFSWIYPNRTNNFVAKVDIDALQCPWSAHYSRRKQKRIEALNLTVRIFQCHLFITQRCIFMLCFIIVFVYFNSNMPKRDGAFFIKFIVFLISITRYVFYGECKRSCHIIIKHFKNIKGCFHKTKLAFGFCRFFFFFSHFKMRAKEKLWSPDPSPIKIHSLDSRT